MPPVLLVCEEAHRYVPADERVGFAATARAITRIAREGRKYGVSLALISQRPSELSAQALSQCGTIFALRLANELDQRFMETVMPDAARGNIATLSSLGTQEAIVCGEGVPLPIRIRFDDLPRARRPRSEGGSPKLGRPIQPMRLSATRECAVGASRAANASPSSDIPVLLAAGNPNMDRQRYCRQLTRYRNPLRVSVEPVAAGEEIADLVGRRRHPPPVETDGSAYSRHLPSAPALARPEPRT